MNALADRKTNLVSLIAASVLFTIALIWALDTASSLPDVYFSYSTNECVQVVNYTDTVYDCENLPKRFYHVWVK